MDNKLRIQFDLNNRMIKAKINENTLTVCSVSATDACMYTSVECSTKVQ